MAWDGMGHSSIHALYHSLVIVVLCVLTIRCDNAMRCLQMGLGKTLTSIAVLWAFARKEACKSLIVCPCSLLANWTREIKLWLGIKMNPLVVTSGMPYIHTYIHTCFLHHPSHCNEHVDLISLSPLYSLRFDRS